MSDSLKDQLLNAGFSEPKPKPRKQKPSNARGPKNKSRTPVKNNTNSRYGERPKLGKPDKRSKGQDSQEAIQRRATKAQIKTLIDEASIKEYAGEEVFRYTLQNRIRELHVKPDIRGQIVEGSLLITRLNGATFLVPEMTAQQIKELNPNWAIVSLSQGPSKDTNDEYGDFPVPDDLQW